MSGMTAQQRTQMQATTQRGAVLRTRFFRRPARGVAVFLAVGQATLGTPLAATAAEQQPASPMPAASAAGAGSAEATAPVSEPTAAPAPPDRVEVNRRVPDVAPPRLAPSFSAEPTDDEIFQARVFGEPLVPVGEETADSRAENAALANALVGRLAGRSDDASRIEAFLQTYPRSRWRLSLLTNLGMVYRRAGYFSKAITTWEQAWEIGKGVQEPRARALAERALAELLDVNIHFGRAESIQRYLDEVEGREVGGSAGEKISHAREGLWLLQNRHEHAIPSGPVALDRLLAYGKANHRKPEAIASFHATPDGATLTQMKGLAAQVGMRMQMAFRAPGSALVAGSMAHFKLGHFTAVVEANASEVVLDDPILGGTLRMSRAAFDHETSGYFLVPEGSLPSGWRTVSPSEADSIRGKCAPCAMPPEPHPDHPDCQCEGGNCPTTPMAQYRFHRVTANLNIWDAPVGYQAPRGPAARFEVHYNHRESSQPAVFSYANLGQKWTFDWLSFVEDDPSSLGANLKLYPRGGGAELHAGYQSGTQSYAPQLRNRAVLVLVSSSPIRYERRLADGSIEVYAQPDGASSFPRRVFMTEVKDPQGNTLSFTYDASLRLVAATDAIGQVTTVSYQQADPLKITRVTDPFGRYATFEYDGSGRLIKITDVIGIASEFEYLGSTQFIRALITPYGRTSFQAGTIGADRWVEAVDPLGGTERLEYRQSTPSMLATEPGSAVPTGFSGHNQQLNLQNSFYWDKRAMALVAGDITKARVTHWLTNAAQTIVENVAASEKEPLETRVWYSYPGQTSHVSVGTQGQPAQVARVLDDASSQIYQYEYNSRGKVTRATDPLGRETVYVHGTGSTPDPDPATGSGIELLQVKQKNSASPGGYDLLESYTYNGQHRPLTATDAAGQTTTFTYNVAGQIATVTTPPRAGITENRTWTFTYDADGRPQNVAGPTEGVTTGYTYDGYGRIRTTMDSDSYTVTYDYDALDRLTRTTFPDATFEETVYNRLDAEKQRDRLGRWTHTFHDAVRRVVAVRDPQGRTTTFQWESTSGGTCGGGGCGSPDKLIDANGNATTSERDLQGRIIREVRADGTAWEYTYEATISRLKQLKDAKNQITAQEYFLDNNLKQMSYSGGAVATPTVSFTYDTAYKRLATISDGTGTTAHSYHPITATPMVGAGRLASIDGPLANDTVSYSYDELGRVVNRGLSGFANTHAYDVLGRLTTIGSPLGNFGYSYDGTSSRPLNLSYPNSQATSYLYFGNTADRRLQQIKNLAPGGATLTQFDYTYDASGSIRTWRQQYGTSPAKVYELGYDPADQLTAGTLKSTDAPPTILKRYGYAYDATGNRTTEQVDDAVFSATYNNRNQLTSRQAGGALVFRGTVNEPATVAVQGKPAQVTPDNRFEGSAQVASGTNTVAVMATDPSGNVRTNTYQVSQSGSPTSYTYDANGNLTSDGIRSFEWDAVNQLARVTQGGIELARFVYDAWGKRAQKVAGGVTRTYIYDGDDVIEERLSSGPVYRYVHGPGIDQPWARTDGGSGTIYYLADHLGSVVQETSAAGTATLTREYDPYGNLIQGAGTSGYAFTGREWDAEIALYYYRARYYDPKTGRFLSEDPIDWLVGLSSFAYVANAPTRFIDPTGLQAASPSGPPPILPPPPGCTAGPWKFVRRITETREEDVWQKARGPDVSFGGPTGAPGGRSGTVRPTFCLCWYELAGRDRVTQAFELFEREVCCGGNTYTEQERMRAGPEKRERISTIMSNPPPRRMTRKGLRQWPTGCLCPASP
jgi:RHS repeat-associated protein